MFFLNHFFHSLGFWQLVVAAIDFILFSFGFFYLHSVCLPSQWKNSIVSLVGMLFKMFDSCVCYVRIRLKVERCFFLLAKPFCRYVHEIGIGKCMHVSSKWNENAIAVNAPWNKRRNFATRIIITIFPIHHSVCWKLRYIYFIGNFNGMRIWKRFLHQTYKLKIAIFYALFPYRHSHSVLASILVYIYCVVCKANNEKVSSSFWVNAFSLCVLFIRK